jgi:hypothetical protein
MSRLKKRTAPAPTPSNKTTASTKKKVKKTTTVKKTTAQPLCRVGLLIG